MAVTNVTIAPIPATYDTAFELGASWKYATVLGSAVDKSRPRLHATLSSQDLAQDTYPPWLEIIVETSSDAVKLKPAGKLSEQAFNAYFRAAEFRKAGADSGLVISVNKFLEIFYNAALAASAKEERVVAKNINGSALTPVLAVCPELSAIDKEVILSDSSAGYAALTSFSLAVMLALNLNDQGLIGADNPSKIVLSEPLFSNSLGTRRVRILVKDGASLDFPLAYTHGKGSVPTLMSFVLAMQNPFYKLTGNGGSHVTFNGPTPYASSTANFSMEVIFDLKSSPDNPDNSHVISLSGPDDVFAINWFNNSLRLLIKGYGDKALGAVRSGKNHVAIEVFNGSIFSLVNGTASFLLSEEQLPRIGGSVTLFGGLASANSKAIIYGARIRNQAFYVQSMGTLPDASNSKQCTVPSELSFDSNTTFFLGPKSNTDLSAADLVTGAIGVWSNQTIKFAPDA